MGRKKITTKEFIKKAIKIHKNKYDYSKVAYTKALNEVIIICKKHGKFKQKATNHLTGSGCQKCGEKTKADKRRSTTEEFIKRAIKVHGNKYDYSKVKYVTSKIKVIIKCKIHKEFKQIPNSHLKGMGCAKCGSKKAGDTQKSTTEEFIKKAKKVHKDKYDYSKTEFKISKIKVKIICKKCNKSFNQFPNNHLSGMGCAKCGSKKAGDKQKSTTEEFIEKAVKTHGNKYNYSKVDYKKAKDRVVIICKKCKESFRQKAYSHLEGYGCQECHILDITSTTKEFIEKAVKIHGDKYDYSKVDYKKVIEKVIIVCKKCKKDFKQIPSSHLNGRGCPYCVGKQLTNMEKIKQFKKIHGDKYDYSETKYISIRTKITIMCKKCNLFFKQTPGAHLNGSGCPMCKRKSEKEVGELLKKHLTNFIITSQKLIYKYVGKDNKQHKRFCDFYLRINNKIIIVEYDGEQHYKPVRFNGMSLKKANKNFERQQYIDKQDENFCSSNDILLWRIKYSEDKKESILNLKEQLKLLN